MAFKYVDQDSQEYNEWGYKSLGGEIESVSVKDSYCSNTDRDEYYLEIVDSLGATARIYVKDIPKLIKAMQEAIASIKEA